MSKIIDISNTWHTLSQRCLYSKTRPLDIHAAVSQTDQMRFHENSAAYSWTNEPLGDLKYLTDYRGKTGLVVAGSGDQPVVFRQLGSAKILVFDISQQAIMWTEFKDVCVQLLTRRQLIHLALEIPETLQEKARHDKLYRVVRHNITEPSRRFFDTILSKKASLPALLVDGEFFRGNDHPFIRDFLPYMFDDNAYFAARQGLLASEMRVVWLDLIQILTATKREIFDYIYLSNIFDRWHLFGIDLNHIMPMLRHALAKHEEAIIICHIDPKFLSSTQGQFVRESVAASAAQARLKFNNHCRATREYWTISHS